MIKMFKLFANKFCTTTLAVLYSLAVGTGVDDCPCVDVG